MTPPGIPCSAGETMAEAPERHFIEHEGHRLCVHAFDGEESLEYVFLHGGPGGRSELGFGEALSERHRTVMYDQFGGGMSDRLAEGDEISFRYYLDEARDVIPRISCGDRVLIGYSWGAALAAGYAAGCDDPRLKGLVLVSPFLSGPVWTEDQISILSEISPEYAERMRRYVDEGYIGPEAMELLEEIFERSLFMHEENRSKAKGMARVPTGEVCLRLWGRNDGIPIGPLRDFDITPRLRDIRVPTLIMYGSRDQVTRRSAESFCDAITGSELLEIDGAGHYTLREEPGIYADAIHRFTGRFGIDEDAAGHALIGELWDPVPIRVFASPHYTVEKARCSICGLETEDPGRSHITGHMYKGRIAVLDSSRFRKSHPLPPDKILVRFLKGTLHDEVTSAGEA